MKTICLVIATMSVMVSAARAEDNLKTTNINRYYMPVRLFLQGAAEVMPEDKYTFKIAPEQMEFGQ